MIEQKYHNVKLEHVNIMRKSKTNKHKKMKHKNIIEENNIIKPNGKL